MTLLDALDGIEHVQVMAGPRCTFARIEQDVTPEEFARLTEILDNPRIKASEISRRLTAAGYTVAASTVERHRKRGTGDGCRCPR